jgi:hypothetical protein
MAALLVSASCDDPAQPGKNQGKVIEANLLCSCRPTHITKDDWRIEFKNGSLPQGPQQEVTIAAILQWRQGPEPGARTPRSGLELTRCYVQKAYLQSLFLRKSDCDLHMEVSEEPGKNAPRMIIETPGTSEYCEARSNMFEALRRKGITLSDLNQELSPPLSVEITGVPFRDQAHPVWFARGSEKVVTLWELHPAIAKISP